MRKNKLLLAIVGLLLGLATPGWAQSEVGAGTFFIKNVSEGTFLTGGNDWGTHASLDAHGLDCELTLSEGNYTIMTGNSQYLQATGYVDGTTAAVWTIAAVSGQKNTYTLANADGKYLVATSNSTDLSLSETAPTTSLGWWQFFSQEDMIKALDWTSASEEDPLDVTFYIDGCNFVRNCDGFRDAWLGKAITGTFGPWTLDAQGTNHNPQICAPAGSAQTNTGCELWNQTSVSLTQKITVPNGKYKLTVDGVSVTEGYSGEVAYLVANEDKGDFTKTSTSEKFAAILTNISNYSEAASVTTIVTDESLTVGIGRDNTGWTVFDNFRLYYLGEVKDEIVTLTPNDATMEEYAESTPTYTYKITDAEGNDITSKVTLTKEPTFTATYTKAKNGTDYTTDVTTGSAAGDYVLTVSGAKAEGYLFNYATGKLTITAKDYSDITENLDLTKGDALTESVATYDYDTALNGTTRYGLQTVPGWTANQKGNDGENSNNRAGGLFKIGSEAQLKGNKHSAPATAYKNETNVIGIVAVWNNKATYTSSDIELAAGSYTLTIPVYNAGGTGTDGEFTNATGITIGEESHTATTGISDYTVGSWVLETITFTVDEATTGNIVLGYNFTKGSGAAPHLFYGIPTLSITRESSYKNGTICYPYVLTPGKNTAIYEIKGRSSDSKTIYFTDAVTETEAGKPYIYEVSEETDGKYVATFNYDPTTKVDDEVEGANQLKGTFTETTALQNCTSGKSAYIVQKGKWVKVPENYWTEYNMTANTAYIADMDAVSEATSDGANAKAMTVDIDGTTTGIDGITLDSKNGDIYNLNGQKVSRAQKGVYIQNGQKRVIK